MANTDKRVTLWYTLRDKVSTGLKSLQSTGKTFSQKMSNAFGQFKKAMDSSLLSAVTFGNIMASAVQKAAGAVLKWMGDATREYQLFQETLTKTYTLLDDNTFEKHGKAIEAGAIKIMQEYNLGIEDVNKALFDSVSAGVDAGDAIQFMEQAAKLAKGGVTNLGVSVDGMTSILNAFNLDMERATDVSNALFTAQKFGKTTVELLSNNIGKVAPIARAAGLSFEELLAATSQLTLSGISTEEAVTAMKGALTAIISPGKEARETFEAMGIPFGKAAFEGGKFGETMELIKNQTEGNIDEISKLIPNVRALLSVTSVATEQGLQKYDEILKAIEGDTTSLNKAFERQMAVMSELIATEEGKLIPAKLKIGQLLSKLHLGWLRLANSVLQTKNVFVEATGWMGQLIGRASGLASKILEVAGIRKAANKELKTIAEEEKAVIEETTVKEEEAAIRKVEAHKGEKEVKLEQNQEFIEANQELELAAQETKQEFDEQAKQFEALNQEERVQLLIKHIGSKRVLQARQHILELQEGKKHKEAQMAMDTLYQEAFIKMNQDKINRIADAEKKALKAKETRDKADKKAEKDRQIAQEIMLQDAKQGTINFFGNMAQIARAQGKEGFLAFKRFSQAQALIATYESATKAFNSLAGIPYVGPVLGGVAAAAAVAAGLMRVRQIENTNPQAEGGGFAPGDGATVNIGEKGNPEWIMNQGNIRELVRESAGNNNMVVKVYIGGQEMRPAIVEFEEEKELMQREGVL